MDKGPWNRISWLTSMRVLSVRTDLSWEGFILLLFFISWKFGFAKHLITVIIILLLFYSSGLLVRGTQCWPVWQILALVIPNLTRLSSSRPAQLHENVWFWLSWESGCKWSRQGRNEPNNSWAGPWPGLKSSLALASPSPLPVPPHRCLTVTEQLTWPDRLVSPHNLHPSR